MNAQPRLISLLALVIVALFPKTGTAQDLAVRDVTIYTSTSSAPKLHANILLHNGTIAALGPAVHVSATARVLPCNGCIVFAGFWNTHVHFTGSQWDDAAHAPADKLSRDLQTMLTHAGFTTVIDLASNPANTTALRRRIESGELAGPRIYTAGFGLYPPQGIPFYLDDLPPATRALLPEPASPAAAVAAVQQNQANGSDVVKLFTGSYLSPDHITHMPREIASAAAGAGHAHQQLVFAHPSDLEGVRIAIDSGVDVLAHSPDTVDGVDAALLHDMIAHHMAMIPTLKLFSGSSHIDRIRKIVQQFHASGGTLLFGTDTGFLSDYDVTEEYHQLQLAGLSFRDVLAMLTTNPPTKLNLAAHAGTLHPGADADLTVLSADPAAGDLRAFAKVRYTIRAGKVIFAAPAQP